MTASRYFLLVIILSGLLWSAVPAALAANLHLVDEQEIYIALDKLNAMGALPGFLANTRPYNMQAVRAAVQEKPWSGMGVPDEVADLGNWVAWYSRPLASAQARVSLAYSSDRVKGWNNEGVPTPEGYSAELSAFGRYEPFPWLSVDGRGVAWFGENDDQGSRFRGYSVEFGHKYISLQVGEISAWYGPGRRGALIFTNNTQSYPGVRLHNPVPIPVPGFLSFLGTVQYDLFFARMDKDRPLPETILNGFRLALRPSRYLELGVSRAIHFGGEGESESLSDWWKAFANTDEDTLDSTTNQLASYDVQLTLPFKSQPVQLYFEYGAEDQARGGYIIPRMAKWANLFGVFLPAILGNPDFDLRVEYADNHMGGHGEDWYVHNFSPHKYKGLVLGHPMGTDARDLFLQGRWFLLPSTYLDLSVNWTERYSAELPTEKTMGVRLAFLGWLTPSLRAGVGFHTEKVTDAGWISGNEGNRFSCWVDLAWRFAGGYDYLLSKERP